MAFQEVSEQVEILLRCDEQLQFTQEVIQRTEIPDSLRIEIQQQVDRIRQRQQDPKLYLAVVGEFSSGKSTFINALLRDELLKTSALIATATATHILYGDALTVEVNFQAPRSSVLHTQPDSKNITVSWLPGIQGLDNRQFIHALTSQDEIAKFVTNLTITHSSSFLANQVVIIDTPGTNADKSEHGTITENVVRQEADLAVIVIPATIPLSQSLADFLGNALKPCLHRCIFVVSRMDAIKPKEQCYLLQDLRSRLVDKLGISPPILHSCSAQVMLDMLHGEENIPEHLQIWSERFTALEKIIIDRLNRERVLSIAENIVRLLSQLFGQLDNHLRSQWDQHETRQVEIKKETIPNLSEFTTEQYNICERQLRNFISTYISMTVSCVDAHKESVSNKIRTELFGVTNEDALAGFLKSQSENFLKEDQDNFQRDLKLLTQKLSADAIAVGKIFDQKFAEVYRRLQSIGGKLEANTNASYSFQVNTSNVVVSAQSLTQKLDSSDGTKMGLGAAGGAMVGTILFPGVGTLVGLAVGSWASRFFMPSLDERKQRLWEQLKPGLDSYFDTVKAQTKEAAIVYTQSLETSLKQRIDAYIQKYKAVIEDLLDVQKTELQRLTQLQKSTQTYLAEIERRQQNLIEKQQKMAESTFELINEDEYSD